MEEKRFYDPIGKWFIREKDCQRDKYSQGYLKNVLVGDIRPDVSAIRYEVITDRVFPVIHFHGYVVEVKSDEKGLNELLGKIISTKRRAKTLEEWASGLHTVKFFIAYPAEQIPAEIIEICERQDIGILRLQIVAENHVNIYEFLEPKKATPLNGMANSSQSSPGVFENSMNRISYLRQMFQKPLKLYDDFIRPKIEEYKKKSKRKEAIDHIKDKEGREACCFLIEKIQSVFPRLEMYSEGSRVIRFKHPKDEDLFSITPTTKYFYISYEKQEYRVYSKRKIGFKNGSKEYEGDLEELVTSMIIPYIKAKLGFLLTS